MASFIREHLEEILTAWESFAKTLSPAATTMNSLALRDHAQQMLEAIALDLETAQSDDEQALKSKGLGPVFHGVETAAAAHGALRHGVGFDLRQLVAEFRALRASVLRLWDARKDLLDPPLAFDMVRFNEAVDQALAEAIATYSDELAKCRETFLTTLGNDLRYPLNAMTGALSAFSESGGEANRAVAFAVGVRSISSMSGMIRDMSEYTRKRLEQGISIVPEEANLESVCRAAIEEVALVNPQTSFRFEAGGNLDGMFDRARIQQVVSNLLDNCVQRGKRGAPICVIASGDEHALALSVSNIGLRTTATKASAASRRTADADLGLGVFVAREIVLAHGGTMHAAPVGSGTTIHMVLPRDAVALGDAASARAPRLRADPDGSQVIH